MSLKYSEHPVAVQGRCKGFTMEEKLYTHWTLSKHFILCITCFTVCKKHCQRGCVCACACIFCFSSFDHADQTHAFIGWNHRPTPTCCISFLLSKCKSCKFLQGQRGEAPPGLHSWHQRRNHKPLKFRVSSLNTDPGPSDPVVFQSSLSALTRAWPSAAETETNAHFLLL